jgi:hypothetical protein
MRLRAKKRARARPRPRIKVLLWFLIPAALGSLALVGKIVFGLF